MFDYKKISFVTMLLWVIPILSFGLYLFFSPHNMLEKKFWTLGYFKVQTQDHDFPFLFFHTKKAVITYLYKGDAYTSQLKTPLLAAIEKFHCVKKDNKNCDSLMFHEMKKEYTIFANLKITKNKLKEHNIDLNVILERLNKLFYFYIITDAPRLIPKIYLTYEKSAANVVVNISLNTEKNVDPNLESEHCPVELTIENNVLTAATFNLLNTDLENVLSGYCVSKMLLTFFDTLGVSVVYGNLSKTDRAIYLGLAAEYYRWLAINNKYPKNKKQLIQSIDDYSNYIYSKF